MFESSTALTVIVCGVSQSPAVKVILDGDTARFVPPVSVIETLLTGSVCNTIV